MYISRQQNKILYLEEKQNQKPPHTASVVKVEQVVWNLVCRWDS